MGVIKGDTRSLDNGSCGFCTYFDVDYSGLLFPTCKSTDTWWVDNLCCAGRHPGTSQVVILLMVSC